MSETSFEGYLAEQFTGGESQETVEETVSAAAEAPVETEGQLRDAQGRFASPEAEQTTEVPAERVEQTLDRYQEDPTKLAAAYAALEKKLGEQARELGELRQQVPQRQQTAPVQQLDTSGIEEWVDNPALAAQAAATAWQQGDDISYERVINAWGQVDPFTAARFDARLQADALTRNALAQVQPTIQQSQEYAARDSQNQALQTVAGAYPDFAAVVSGIDFDTIADKAEASPILEIALKNAMQNRDTRSYQALFETLYLVNRQEQVVQHEAATTVANQAAQQEAASEKQRAVVASASSPPVTAEGTAEDKELEAFYDFMRAPSPTSWADLRPAGQ